MTGMRGAQGVGSVGSNAYARYAWIPDRTAVLILGLITGFSVGIAFGGGGQSSITPPGPPHIIKEIPARSPTLVTSQIIDPRVIARMKADGRLRVGVFGDSFGNGVWEALYQQLPREDGYDVQRFSKEGTGFTRNRRTSLDAQVSEQLSQHPIDVAVISFGANDAEPLYAEQHIQPLMSEGWQRIVSERIDRFVAATRATGAIVYWVGLPVMRDPQMDTKMQAMDAFYEQHMRRLGVKFLDSRPLSVDAKGEYTAYLPDKAGVPRLMRTGDGVHMLGIGYQRLTDRVANDVRDYAMRARRAAGVSAAEPAADTKR